MAFEKEEQAKRDAQASLKASLLENEAKLRAKQEAKRQEQVRRTQHKLHPLLLLLRIQLAHNYPANTRACGAVLLIQLGCQPLAPLVAHVLTPALACARPQIRDQQFMDEYAAMLERQERARKEQRDRIFSRQARQAEDAKNRPEAKQWVDPALIEKYRVEKDMAAAAEERRRMNRIKEVNMKAKLAFDEQVRHAAGLICRCQRVARVHCAIQHQRCPAVRPAALTSPSCATAARCCSVLTALRVFVSGAGQGEAGDQGGGQARGARARRRPVRQDRAAGGGGAPEADQGAGAQAAVPRDAAGAGQGHDWTQCSAMLTVLLQSRNTPPHADDGNSG